MTESEARAMGLPLVESERQSVKKVIDLIAKMRPDLLEDAPFMISLCDVFHQAELELAETC